MSASGRGFPNPHSHEHVGFAASMCSTTPGCTFPMARNSFSMCPQCRLTTCGSYGSRPPPRGMPISRQSSVKQ